MNQQLKQRLVGATVLIVLGIIFLPMILDKPAPVKTKPDITNFELNPYKQNKVAQSKSPVRSIPPEVIARYEEMGNKQNPIASVPKTKNEVKPDQKPFKMAHLEPETRPKKSPEKTESEPKWAVQMGSFSNKENANRLVQRLKNQKYPAYYEDAVSAGKTIYRVRVGPFNSKAEIEKIKQKLDQKEKLKTLIVILP